MSYLAPVKVVGGQGGTPFTFNDADTGAVIKKVEVWVAPDLVRFISVLMTDGAQQTYGTAEVEGDLMLSFTFEDGEYFSDLSLWPNSTGDRLSGFRFKTTKCNFFEACMVNGKSSVTETPVDVGSGLCFGVKGRSGTEINAFGFLFQVKSNPV
uniref:Jacalin-type lectin domain-containing protein n=1 Tax=Oryzias latipes TaxID=8090 RepID=A0A3P9KL00_ORYLA